MTSTQKVFVPEEHFREVPDSFSGESNIVSVESRVCSNGIILDNLKEVECALRIHNGEMLLTPVSSTFTNMDLIGNMFKSAGPMGAGLAAMASQTLMKGKDFVGTMMAEARCNLATTGKYHRSYDYDAMGTNFLKTSVTVARVESKFVLNISGSRVETDLSVLLGKRVALSSAVIYANLSVVDEWWYNLNLKKVLGDIGYLDPDFEPTWPQLAQVLASEGHQFRLPILKDGVPLDLLISVDYSSYRYPSEEDKRASKDLTRAIGSNVAGATWNAYRHQREEATNEDRKLQITVAHHGRGYGSSPVIDPAFTDALATVAREIEEKLIKKVVA